MNNRGIQYLSSLLILVDIAQSSLDKRLFSDTFWSFFLESFF